MVKHKLKPTVGTGTTAAAEPQAHDTHKTLSAKEVRKLLMFSSALVRPATVDSLRKLSSCTQAKSPVIFVVYTDSILTTILWTMALHDQVEMPAGSILAASMRLWLMVLFANFAGVLIEDHSKQQAASLHGIKTAMQTRMLADASRRDCVETRTATAPRCDDIVLVEAGDIMSGNNEVIEGAASADESAITGESAPVIRESGGDFPSVAGSTHVLSDWIVVHIAASPGENSLSRMISMVEGVKYQKTSSELALMTPLMSPAIILVLATVTLLPYSIFSAEVMKAGSPITITVPVALLMRLISATVGGLLSATGVAGMNRTMQVSVIAAPGHAVEAAGDVDVLLLDRTDAIAYGNHQASCFIPVPDVTAKQLAEAVWLSSPADETLKGRNIITPTRNLGGAPIDEAILTKTQPVYVAFLARTHMNGTNIGHNGEARQVRKGAADAARTYMMLSAGKFPDAVLTVVDDVACQGGTPLVVSDNDRASGVVELKDIVKVGIHERSAELRQISIKTVMITGGNHLTATPIAAEAGVDDFIVGTIPKTKLTPICEQQTQDRLVAMTGDGTSDAPVLAQADTAVAMNGGTQAAKGVGNMADLGSSPTKLVQIVEIGKQMLMTRGSPTTFSIANDVTKYFAIISVAFMTTCPQLIALNMMHLATPASAVVSVVILSASIIVLLIPPALKGVKYRALGAITLLRRNLSICDLSSLSLPSSGIEIINMLLAVVGWA